MTDEAGRVPVLVTGGAGYIGSHAVLALLDAGWPVVVIDNLSTGFDWAVPQGAVVRPRATSPTRRLLARLIAEHGIGAIMHFAGSVVVPESVEDPLKYYQNNTVKSRALIESAVKGGVRHFIFSSTAATYGIPDTVPVAEEAPTEPINPYGWSKLMTERMLKDSAAAYPLNYCALRYFNVAGADPAGPLRPIDQGRDPFDQGRGRGGDRQARPCRHLRQRLRHARRHRRPRLYPCQRPRRRPCPRARAADRRAGGEPGDELRLWPRLLGHRGARLRRPDHQPARSSAGRCRAAPAIRRRWSPTTRVSSPPCPGGPNATVSTRSSPMRWPGSAGSPSAASRKSARPAVILEESRRRTAAQGRGHAKLRASPIPHCSMGPLLVFSAEPMIRKHMKGEPQ